MTSITWDTVGERAFQTGIDRGVLYPSTGDGVPWNGLTSVEESIIRDQQTHHLDGIKYLEYQTAGDYEGKLKAFTYPDEFDIINGIQDQSGMRVHEQPTQRFGLSYRTKLGNDVNGIDLGYKITLLYRLMASADATSFGSLGGQISPAEFSWSLSGIPVAIAGSKATTQISFDSTKVDPFKLEIIESILYGSETSAPRLPSPDELIEILETTFMVLIIDHGDGTWSAYGPPARFTAPSAGEFQITSVDSTVIDANTYTVTTTLT